MLPLRSELAMTFTNDLPGFEGRLGRDAGQNGGKVAKLSGNILIWAGESSFLVHFEGNG